MYDYTPPPGYGDTFFIYAVNGEDIPLVDGQDYSLVGLPVQDTDFVWRAWSGGYLLTSIGTVQVYDGVRNAFFQQPILGGNFPPAMAIIPEKTFRVNSNFRFDITHVSLQQNTGTGGACYADQMAWYGVKRWNNGASDPGPSTYKYYEKPFSYPLTFQINNYGPNSVPGLAAPTQYTQLITDFDFELRRILMTQGAIGGGPSGGGFRVNTPYNSQFKITLYDATWRSRSNIPLLSELLCTEVVDASPAANNAWPCPPVMYPINSVIRFDIYSLIPPNSTLPVTITLLFDGVRRIPC